MNRYSSICSNPHIPKIKPASLQPNPLRQSSLNTPLQIPLPLPNPHYSQPRLPQQPLPLLLRPLHAPKTHHVDILQSDMARGVHLGDHGVGDEDAGAGRHGGDRVLQDAQGDGVGPVVEDAAEVVDVCV